MPPAWVTQTASHTQKPRTAALSPTIDPASGVNENMPFSVRVGIVRAHAARERREHPGGFRLADVEVPRA